jgi:2-polyprenyl-6-methoxyphenol hydroxylase-like FAD-dependent oxidoreductase
MQAKRIGIAGAGPAGLVAALAARRLGVEATVYAQAPNFERVGGGILVHSNGLRVLAALGLVEALEARGRTTQVMRVETAEGRVLSTFDYRKLDIPFNRAMICLRHTLQEVLVDAALAEGVDVRFSRRCAGATSDGDGARLRFDDGGEERFDAVLACDGINSRVREALGLETRRKVVGEAYLRGVAPLAVANPTIREVWGSRGRRFGICPLDDAHVYFFCNAPLGRWRETLDGGIADFVASWRDFNADAVTILSAVPDWTRVNYSELNEVVLDRWYDGRVFLVGDAAHAMTPNLGQGANSAMVDALVLVRLLAREPVERVGPAYEAVRKRFVTRIQDASRQIGEIAAWGAFFSRFVRDGLLGFANRVDALSRPGMLLGAGYNGAEDEFFDPV